MSASGSALMAGIPGAVFAGLVFSPECCTPSTGTVNCRSLPYCAHQQNLTSLSLTGNFYIYCQDMHASLT